MKQQAILLAAGALALAAGCEGGDGAAENVTEDAAAQHYSGSAQGSATAAASDRPAYRPEGQPPALPPGAQIVSQTQIVDQNGFERPMTAATALVPAGWRTQGGVVWSALGQCGGDYLLNWSAVSPDGAASISVVPAANWGSTRSVYAAQQPDPCHEATYTTAREYLEGVAGKLVPGARPLDYRPRPDEAKPLADMIAQLPPLNTDQMQSQFLVDAGELLVGYSENGREMRAVLSVLVLVNHVRMADLVSGGVGVEALKGFPGGVTVVRAPEGQLDFGLRKRIMSSLVYMPEWRQAVARYNARKHKTFSDGMTAAHEARMSAIRATSDIINGNYNARDIASDRAQRERVEAIRGVETYHDPVSGGSVQLDNTYNHAWRVNNMDNTYILTNDPSFNPGLYSIDAQQMQAVQ